MEIKDLHDLFLECNSICTDTRKITKNDMFVALKGDRFNGNHYAKQALEKGAKYIIIDETPIEPLAHAILVKNTLTTLQELATYHRDYLNIPIIALTGSNGKTTTKELIHAVLEKKYKTTATLGNLNNHIGVPLTLLSMHSNTEIGVVEMGANHQKEIAFLCSIAKPNYGYITNFGKAHLEGFGSFEGVIKGKSEIYHFLNMNNNTIFVNGNDPIQINKTNNSNRFVFGNTPLAHLHTTFLKAEPFVKCQYNNLKIKSKLIGDYNYNNIAAAIAIGHYFKIEDHSIKEAIESYKPTNNRSQIIKKESNNIVLDAYNANPSSMHAALLNFEKQSGSKIAILGDMFELGKNAKEEHQNILNLAISLTIDSVIFIGENFYQSKCSSKKVQQFKNFEEFKNNFNISLIDGSSILIKGSRGMTLERVLDFL